jgi:hypothetical protein
MGMETTGMDRDTMEYSLKQNVLFDAEEMFRGRLTDEEYAEIAETQRTGKIVGHFSNYFIVSLDQALKNGETAVLVPADACRPLTCHWCRDTKKVNDTPFTMGQYEADAIPMRECPYCAPKKVCV